ncbi:MAG TPA: glucose 1-dehydrogenase [Thermoanaerobaculia bacterium]|nr:glucose 1-dehydrogenase [Thermoanaerobaculia bacterium]
MERTSQERRFTGRVALVTGGSSGIGRAAALAFAGEGAGVVIASRGTERGEAVQRELEALGAAAEFVPTDVSQAGQVETLVRRTVERFGRLDCAFNNAAAIDVGVYKATADFSEEEFDQHLAFNLKSVWLCMKHEIAQMLRQGSGGTIVNTSSVNGLGGVPFNGLYAAAKAGVLGLTKSAAQEYAKQGIRVNALVAGGFRTPMLEGVFKRASPDDPAAVEAGFAQLVPLGRIGRPEEAAEAVLWLCSDASSYLTGNSLIVDGGLTSPYR